MNSSPPAGEPPFAGAGHLGTIPAVFIDSATAQGVVSAGSATLQGQEPTWGFMRVFDAESGEQVAKFDGTPHMHDGFNSPEGAWTIHNTEVQDERAYSSWYANGIVALDLSPLDKDSPSDPLMVGQFIPPGTVVEPPPGEPGPPFAQSAAVWGVAVRDDGVIFVSDIFSGLWIIEPTGLAASGDDEDERREGREDRENEERDNGRRGRRDDD